MTTVRLVAVGDVLMHQDVKQVGRDAPEGLGALWRDVGPLLREADVAFANLETPIAPTTGRPGIPFQFNAPEELPGALRDSGFTVLATANNHAFDQGHKGVLETLERLRAAGLEAVGSGATRAEAEAPRILRVRGLRVAFLGFTDIFNVDLNRLEDRPWVRALDPEAAAAAVRAARAQADAVVVSIHWGGEYLRRPLDRQRRVAERLTEAGADLILGHHPHVLQPVEVLERGGHRTVVVYSMGNFVSNQDRMYQEGAAPVQEGDSRDGVAFQCRLEQWRQPDGTLRVALEAPACVPLWTDNNWHEHRARGARRLIRVVPVPAAIAAAQGDLERLGAGEAGPRQILEARLRLLRLRQARAEAVLAGRAETPRRMRPAPVPMGAQGATPAPASAPAPAASPTDHADPPPPPASTPGMPPPASTPGMPAPASTPGKPPPASTPGKPPPASTPGKPPPASPPGKLPPASPPGKPPAASTSGIPPPA